MQWHSLGAVWLGSRSAEKALGSRQTGREVKVSQQCALAARKGSSSLLGCMKRSTASRAREATVPLSSALLRLYLEYHSQVWLPERKKDIDEGNKFNRG